MRLNRLCFCIPALFCLILLFCSRSDVITGVGDDVISDSDPTLVDMDMGFSLITFDCVKAGDAFSLPKNASGSFGTQTVGWFMTGVNDHGDTLRAHTQFLVLSDTSRYTKNDSLVGVFLYFRAVGSDTASAAGEINVYSSDTLRGMAPVDPQDAANDNIGSFKLGVIDSIPLSDSLAKRIFDVRTSAAKDSLPFAFSIVDYIGGVRKINSPYIIIHVITDGGKTVRDSIPGFARFTAFENGQSVNERSEQMYSAQHTLRTAVFEIDINSIIKVANSKSGRRELINATLSFMHDKEQSGGANQYKFLVLDTLLTNEAPGDSVQAARGLSLQRQFALVSSSTLNAKGNVHSIKNPLRNAVDNNREYIYVYLRAVSDHSVILWDKSSFKVEAILTPAR